MEICEKVLGPEHPNTATSLNNISHLLLAKGERGRALDAAVRWEQVQSKVTAQILSFTSEQERMAYQRTFDPFSLFATLGQGPETAQALLRYKGVVLDSLLEDRLIARQSQKPEDRALLEELRTAKGRLSQILFDVPQDLSPEAQRQRQTEEARLATQAEDLEKQLAKAGNGPWPDAPGLERDGWPAPKSHP